MVKAYPNGLYDTGRFFFFGDLLFVMNWLFSSTDSSTTSSTDAVSPIDDIDDAEFCFESDCRYNSNIQQINTLQLNKFTVES